MTEAKWLTEYLASRRDLITANGGQHAVSLIGLLPEPPAGVWSAVGAHIGSLASPVSFLSHMFCELSGNRQVLVSEVPISLDGFLGSAHS